jgi:ferredoxin
VRAQLAAIRPDGEGEVLRRRTVTAEIIREHIISGCIACGKCVTLAGRD